MFERWKLLRTRARLVKELPPPETDDFGMTAYKTDEFTKSRFRKIRFVDRQLAELAAKDLFNKAQRLDVPIPGDEPDLTKEFEETAEYRAQLRKLIDDEKTRRREITTWWWTKIVIPAISMLIGLTGAITDLVAVLRHK